MKTFKSFRFVAFAAIMGLAGQASAAGFGGAGHMGGGIAAPGLSPSVFAPNPYSSPQRYRDLKIAGRAPVDESKLPQGARVIQLRVDGEMVPMALDTEEGSSDPEFDPYVGYGRELYRAALSKRVEVVGDERLRNRITESVKTHTPIEIEGYVFDRLSPYLVVRSVTEAEGSE
ncbi:MAG TPA: hypothetical protein VIX12_02130 [Candidatus Binataceae bacterium]